MGTTKVKIIDLSSENQSVKASQKHAQSLGSAIKIKKEKPQEENQKVKESEQGSEKAETQEAAVSEEQKPAAKPKAKKAKSPKAQKHHLGKKYKEALEKIEKGKLYSVTEALDLLPKTSFTKFDPSVEIHIGISAKSLRGTVNFPHTTGPKKEKKYLVFSDKQSLRSSSNDDSTAGLKQNTDLKNVTWANEDSIADLESGKLKPGRDFSAVIANPKFMPLLAKVAKVLGPAGMMPNPKNGTITENPAKAIEEGTTAGSEFQTDPTAPIIHSKIGKLSEKPEYLKENLKALVLAIGPQKIKRATITSTMGPGIKIDVATL